MRDIIIKRFKSYNWHDSKMTSFEVVRRKEGEMDVDEVCFNLYLRSDSKSANNTSQKAKLIFRDCIFLECHLNLVGKRRASDDISDAYIMIDSELKDIMFVELGESIGYFYPQVDDYLHFRVDFIPPGGVINILARDFELVVEEFG